MLLIITGNKLYVKMNHVVIFAVDFFFYIKKEYAHQLCLSGTMSQLSKHAYKKLWTKYVSNHFQIRFC